MDAVAAGMEKTNDGGHGYCEEPESALEARCLAVPQDHGVSA